MAVRLPTWMDSLSAAATATIEAEIQKQLGAKFAQLVARNAGGTDVQDFIRICDHFIQSLPPRARGRAKFVEWKEESATLIAKCERQALQKDIDGVLRLYAQDLGSSFSKHMGMTTLKARNLCKKKKKV